MLSTTSLLSLLPLLALVSAFPFDPSQPRFVPRQTNGTTSADVGGVNGATPLSFQSVGDAGISAQMVSLFSSSFFSSPPLPLVGQDQRDRP